jgi:peptidoglycan/LPS O-acetylase OafA/YrhL
MFYLFFPLACRILGRGMWLIALLVVFVSLGPFARTAKSTQALVLVSRYSFN